MGENIISYLTSFNDFSLFGYFIGYFNTHPHYSFHILISTITLSILAIAGFQALILHVQNYALRNKKNTALIGLLPPIESMKKILFQIIFFGFICLSFTLIGAIGLIKAPYSHSHVHKISLSFLAWIFFAILLFQHYRYGAKGNRAVHFTLGGVVLLIITYFCK